MTRARPRLGRHLRPPRHLRRDEVEIAPLLHRQQDRVPVDGKRLRQGEAGARVGQDVGDLQRRAPGLERTGQLHAWAVGNRSRRRARQHRDALRAARQVEHDGHRRLDRHPGRVEEIEDVVHLDALLDELHLDERLAAEGHEAGRRRLGDHVRVGADEHQPHPAPPGDGERPRLDPHAVELGRRAHLLAGVERQEDGAPLGVRERRLDDVALAQLHRVVRHVVGELPADDAHGDGAVGQPGVGQGDARHLARVGLRRRRTCQPEQHRRKRGAGPARHAGRSSAAPHALQNLASWSFRAPQAGHAAPAAARSPPSAAAGEPPASPPRRCASSRSIASR